MQKFTEAEGRALHELDFVRQNMHNNTEWHKPRTSVRTLRDPRE